MSPGPSAHQRLSQGGVPISLLPPSRKSVPCHGLAFSSRLGVPPAQFLCSGLSISKPRRAGWEHLLHTQHGALRAGCATAAALGPSPEKVTRVHRWPDGGIRVWVTVSGASILAGQLISPLPWDTAYSLQEILRAHAHTHAHSAPSWLLYVGLTLNNAKDPYIKRTPLAKGKLWLRLMGREALPSPPRV